MRAFVDLEILAACEHFAAAREQTRERFLACVNPDVIDQLVLGLERSQASTAVDPQTDVDALVGRSDVFQTDVSDKVVHGVERAAAAGSVVQPATDQLLLDTGRWSQVAQ